jgi:ABC-type sugar transport system ATPase subunit
MISSELPEILGMSDRILVVRKNTIVGEYMRAEATQEKIIATAMGLDQDIAQGGTTVERN